ncbi:MAG: hypothetical protein KAG89_07870 [Fulvimarina manganoxydans]|uniref:hypothetical protein n=1 Tax=Fulvimarina manganoxydans TaxID=937218 RepID=UPI002355AEDB|nr:hypothetical protein [Fulvimarina manganoxydans]MCK5932076.1 hypothetical protein [Fulvimarina manganoxydans]
MLAKLKALLKSDTTADITAAMASIDLTALRAALDAANAERTRLLLSGSDAEIRRAEAEIEACRLALDRGEAARTELEGRLAQATEREAEAAIRAEHAEITAKRDAIVARIKTEYPKAAATIISIIEDDRGLAAALSKINDRAHAGDLSRYGLGLIKTPSDFVWGNQYLPTVHFDGHTSLLPTDSTPAVGIPAEMPRR